MLEVKQLYFARGDTEFFHGLDLQIAPGELLQITGANGSGKTTLLRLLAGFLPPAQGEVRRQGRCAYIGHHPGLSSQLTAAENLRLTRCLYQSDAALTIPELLSRFALTAQADILAVQLSAGQQRRLALANLLLMQANLWLLDEPFAGLDQSAIALTRELIQAHLAMQGGVILTTHQPLGWQPAAMKHLHLEQQTCGYFMS